MGRVAQVEMRIEIDDAYAWGGLPWDGLLRGLLLQSIAAQMPGKPLPATERHFMASAKHDRQMARIEQCADIATQTSLRRFQIAVGAPADLCLWDVQTPAELAYAVQPGRLRQRVFGGVVSYDKEAARDAR